MGKLVENLQSELNVRKSKDELRQLFNDKNLIDFITNDYLGFSGLIHVESSLDKNSPSASRLLGGNNDMILELEASIASFHGYEAALFYTSGYAANSGLFSCLLTRHDTYIYDEQIHASIRDGIRLSLANSFSFKHNDLLDLQEKIKNAKGNVVVVTEAVFSMEGDTAPLTGLVRLCKENNCEIIVDEAHSIGLFGNEGRGLVHQLNLTKDVFAVVYTYGKAMGAHGGAIAGSKVLRDYLVNFSRPFIYTTAPSFHQVMAVKTAYSLLASPIYDQQLRLLKKNVAVFEETIQQALKWHSFKASHINGLKTVNKETTIQVAAQLREKGYNCRPVLSPTVAPGDERIRVNIHAYNTIVQIQDFIHLYANLVKS